MRIMSMNTIVPFAVGVAFAMFIWPYIQQKWVSR